MPFIVALLCFLALWIWSKIADREKPWQKIYREAWQKHRAGEISYEEYSAAVDESFRLQHRLPKK